MRSTCLACHTKGPPKSGPPGPIFAKKWSPGPILAAKIGLPGLILAAKIAWSPPCQSPTDRDARTEFGKHDLLANNYTFSYL